MTYYQLIYLIPATLDPEEIKKIQANVHEILNQGEAKIIKEFESDKKKLSYAIKQVRHGIYIKIHFNIEQNKLASIQKNLKLTTNLLRFILTKEKPGQKKIKAKRKPLHLETDKSSELDVITVKTTKQENKKKTEINLEELDKKLDEILED